jgi:hypothetical protein
MRVERAETQRRGYDAPVFPPRCTAPGPDAGVSRVRRHTGAPTTQVCRGRDTPALRRDAPAFPPDAPVSRARRICVTVTETLRRGRGARVFLPDTPRFRPDAGAFSPDTPAFRENARAFSLDAARSGVRRALVRPRTMVRPARCHPERESRDLAGGRRHAHATCACRPTTQVPRLTLLMTRIASAPLIRLRHLLPIAVRLRQGEGYLRGRLSRDRKIG